MNATRGFEAQRLRGFRNAALGVSIFLLAMVPWRLTGAPGPGPMRVLALHAAIWSCVLLVYIILLGSFHHRLRNAESPGFVLLLIGLSVTSTQLLLYARLQETASTLLISLASGVVLRRRSTLALFQIILLGVWGGLAIHITNTGQMATWLFDIVLAGVFAFAIQRLLVNSTSALLRRIGRQHDLIRTNATLLEELRESLQNVRTLSGLIPICAHCKKIRNDEGYWEQVESYIRARSEARFSHGVCPDCAKEMMASLNEE